MELEKLLPGSEKRFEFLFQQLSTRKPQFLNTTNLPESVDTLDTTVLSDLERLIETITSQHSNIKSDADLLTLIQTKEIKLQLLEDKKFVLDNRESIESNIRRYKAIAKLEALGRECNTRAVSTLASQIYQDSAVTPLLAAFTNELKQFGFIRFSIKAKTRNRAGNQQLKLVVEDGGEPLVSTIASEGEQRCIAIAAFLAEMKADNRKSAVIFDDPVNSLSHQWRSRVAERLVSESLERQVIVFTHDIVFYKLLLEAAERLNANHDTSALERSRQNLAGIVSKNAPWEALTTSKRLKALNVELQDIKKIDKKGTEAEFRKASREFYGRLRESWERLIEEKLLNRVVNRFERGIQTQRLRRLTDITDADIAMVDTAMTKCSTYFTGHDSAPAVGDPYPTVEEIEADLKQLSNYLDELQGKVRKRN
ncbi:AAA family ATPase [Vibrio sp. HN007]|uniref:AAA family ATPase n=1 Tax=Vibrio iocasae TaxID=3098914 RepID=UPI0035D41191